MMTMGTETQPEPHRNSRQQKSGTEEPIFVAEWAINIRRDSLRISLENFRGIPLINIRKWYVADDGEKRPTRRGIALSVKNLPELAEAISTALSIALERGLIEELGDDGDDEGLGGVSHETSSL
jgi:Transcriptional Coactivator p15 (PC4)